MANTYISRTFGTPTNSAIWTLSFWIKRSSLSPSSSQKIFAAGTGSTDRTEISFAGGNDGLNIYRNISGSTAGLDSTRKFRDTNAWYHIVIQNNNGTAAVYVNGEAETMSSTSLGTNKINLASTIHIFGDQVASGQNFDGLMSHIHFVDGTIYAPTVFGSTDSTTGQWQINTSPSITMGNNGFTILKDGNTITDQSANSNDFSLSSGTLTKTEDSPSNVFATLNPLDNYYANATFSYGNTRITTGSSREASVTATIPMFKGKYYWETKMVSANAPFVGIQPIPSFGNTASPAPLQLNGYGLLKTGKVETTDGSGGSNILASYATYTTGDIIGTAVDLDSAQNKIYFYKNGTLLGASGVNITSVGSTSQGMYLVGVGVIASQDTLEVNFGNGYFGTTAVSSAGANASGIGIFEYDVPTGYTALSTKGLNL